MMTLPSLSDNFYKILVTIGILIISYCSVEWKDTTKEYVGELKEFTQQSIELEAIAIKYSMQLNREVLKSKMVFQKHDIQVYFDSNALKFIPKYPNLLSKEQMLICDSLNIEFLSVSDARTIVNNEEDNLIIEEEYIEDFKKDYGRILQSLRALTGLGFLLVIFGFIGIYRQSRIQDKLLYAQLQSNDSEKSNCQSCGKRFSAIRMCGTNKDGGPNKSFCGECFTNGLFIKYEKVGDVINEVKNSRLDDRKKSRIISNLQNLERWNTNEY